MSDYKSCAVYQKGCYGCQYAYWDSDGCTCGIRNITVGNPKNGCAKRVDTTEQAETEHDAVNHPSHYTAGGIECIEALKAATTRLTGIEAVCTANAIKYLWRWKGKNGSEDIRKAIWYCERLLKEIGDERTE